MSERTERSEGHERMPGDAGMSERTERSEGHERMPGHAGMSAPALEDVVATVLEVQPGEVTDASSTDTLAAWTSMRHLELVVALEDAYHLSFEFREIST